MNRFGINVELKNTPVLDPDFMPLMRFNRAFLAGAKSRWASPWSGGRTGGGPPHLCPRDP